MQMLQFHYHQQSTVIKKTTAIPGSVTIDPEGVQTIDGSLTRTISTNNETVVIQSNGAVWYKVN